MKKCVLFSSLLVLFCLMLSCKKTPTAPEVPAVTRTSVTITSSKSTLWVGETTQMTATVRMSDGSTKPATGTWSSDWPNVATVSSSGLVTGIGSGDATIICDEGGGLIGSKKVTVKSPTAWSVTVRPYNDWGKSTIYVGQTEQMEAVASMTDGTDIPAIGTWGSHNTNVATVNQSGLVTGISSGTATIYIDTTEWNLRGTKLLTVRKIWSKSGVGDNVFAMPTYVSRVRVVATYTGYAQNFIVYVGGWLFVNELMGTGFDQTRFEGTYLTSGGVVEITSSSGVSWSFTQVLSSTAITNSSRKLINIPSKSDPRYREYEIYLREAAKKK